MRTHTLAAATLLLAVAFVTGLGPLRFRNASAQVSETFNGNIVLGRPTDHSITVNALFVTNQDSVYIEYGDASGNLTKQTSPKNGIVANVPFEDVIDSLLPNTRYYYRIRYRANAQASYGATAEHSFTTQRSSGSSFTFTIVADSHLFTAQHCDPLRYAQTLQNCLSDSPDFHVDLGDTFRTDTIVNDQTTLTYQQVLDRHIAHRPYFGILTHSVPLFLVQGNHDSEYLYYTTAGSGENANNPYWSTNARLAQFPNPRPDSFYSGDTNSYPGIDGGLRESYFAWQWGDALFVVLDPYWENPSHAGTNWSPVHGDRQFAWFRDTLRNSKAKYKFVFEHHLHGQSRGGVEVAPLYEWGGIDKNGSYAFPQNRPTWDKPFHDLMAENNVTIYFQGHDHLFAHAAYKGVHYVSAPMPGAVPDPGATDYFPGNTTDGNWDAYPASHVLPNSGHLRVSVTPDNVKVDYVSVKLPRDPGVNRSVVYSFTTAPSGTLALVSAANYANIATAPEALMSAFGAGLAGPNGPTTLTIKDAQGVSRDAQLLYAGPGQINFLIPQGTAPGTASFTVNYAGNAVASSTYTVTKVAPAMFTANQSGLGVAAAVAVHVKADGSQITENVFKCTAGTGSCTTAPLDLGLATDQLYISLFGTGLRNVGSLSEVTARIGGDPAEVSYAGPQGFYLGLDQVNLKVPKTLAGRGDVAVMLSVSGRPIMPVYINIK